MMSGIDPINEIILLSRFSKVVRFYSGLIFYIFKDCVLKIISGFDVYHYKPQRRPYSRGLNTVIITIILSLANRCVLLANASLTPHT